MFPYFALVTAMLLWATSFIALKLAFTAYDPMVVIFARMAIASLCFLPFFFRLLPQVRYRKGDWKLLGIMVLCEPCLYFIFEAKALTLTTASQASMITAVLPLLVAIGAMLTLNERVSTRTFCGFALAMSGAVGLSLTGTVSENAPNPLLGNTFEFLAMVCAAAYTLLLKRLSERYPVFLLTGFQAFCGSIFFFPVLFFPGTPLPQTFIPVPALSVFYLGVCITLGAYGLYNYGVSRIPASQASAYVNLIPVFTVFFGWLILGEQFTMPQYFCAALVLSGVAVSQHSIPEPSVPPLIPAAQTPQE
ncbi:DMT family transporter [Desulfobotulus alkaliphilus]|nr:DMT family transporter [Desulfobotulus alkaliphilus]